MAQNTQATQRGGQQQQATRAVATQVQNLGGGGAGQKVQRLLDASAKAEAEGQVNALALARTVGTPELVRVKDAEGERELRIVMREIELDPRLTIKIPGQKDSIILAAAWEFLAQERGISFTDPEIVHEDEDQITLKMSARFFNRFGQRLQFTELYRIDCALLMELSRFKWAPSEWVDEVDERGRRVWDEAAGRYKSRKKSPAELAAEIEELHKAGYLLDVPQYNEKGRLVGVFRKLPPAVEAGIWENFLTLKRHKLAKVITCCHRRLAQQVIGVKSLPAGTFKLLMPCIQQTFSAGEAVAAVSALYGTPPSHEEEDLEELSGMVGVEHVSNRTIDGQAYDPETGEIYGDVPPHLQAEEAQFSVHKNPAPPRASGPVHQNNPHNPPPSGTDAVAPGTNPQVVERTPAPEAAAGPSPSATQRPSPAPTQELPPEADVPEVHPLMRAWTEALKEIQRVNRGDYIALTAGAVTLEDDGAIHLRFKPGQIAVAEHALKIAPDVEQCLTFHFGDGAQLEVHIPAGEAPAPAAAEQGDMFTQAAAEDPDAAADELFPDLDTMDGDALVAQLRKDAAAYGDTTAAQLQKRADEWDALPKDAAGRRTMKGATKEQLRAFIRRYIRAFRDAEEATKF